ncbi:metallothionein-like protein type 2 [Jatropha curcas]|uniref:metallothionein-like protein type 2 n=1 Tax=Jatropha curcas TaxID=180498 RepID=UPI001894749D|nr:metallothionein-like protein type 2 [Jatropha curcas]
MSCCGGNCGCGSGCGCGSSCKGCGMYPDISESTRTETLIAGTETLIAGVAPSKKLNESSEMSFGAEGGHGCKCGSNCSCDPCNATANEKPEGKRLQQSSY